MNLFYRLNYESMAIAIQFAALRVKINKICTKCSILCERSSDFSNYTVIVAMIIIKNVFQ